MKAGLKKIALSYLKNYANWCAVGAKFFRGLIRVVQVLFISCIRLYQLLLSPYIGGQCRFEPSCSHYAIESLRQHGLKGLVFAFKRISKCHPWGPYGVDPVPQKRLK